MKKNIWVVLVFVFALLLGACTHDTTNSEIDSYTESEESKESAEESEDNESEESQESEEILYPWDCACVFSAKNKEFYAGIYNFDANSIGEEGLFSCFSNDGGIYLLEETSVEFFVCTHTRVFFILDGYLCSNSYYGDDPIQHFTLDIRPNKLRYHDNELWYVDNETLYRVDLVNGGEEIVTIHKITSIMNKWGDIVYLQGNISDPTSSETKDIVYHMSTGEYEEVIEEMYEYYSALGLSSGKDPI